MRMARIRRWLGTLGDVWVALWVAVGEWWDGVSPERIEARDRRAGKGDSA